MKLSSLFQPESWNIKHLNKKLSLGLALLLVATNIVPANAAFVPDNKIGITMFGFVLGGAYSEVAGQPTGTGQIKNGNVGAYPEGSCIPIEIEVKNKDNTAGDILISPVFDYFNTTVGVDQLEVITTGLSGNPRLSADNLNDFTYSEAELTTATSFVSTTGSVSASVSGPFEGADASTDAPSATDASRHYNVLLTNVAAGETVYLTFCARVGVDASLYNGGAALSIRSAQGGNENVPIPVNQLLALPSITITKTVNGGPNTANDFTFTLNPDVNGHVGPYSITNGSSVTIDNVNPDGNYSITESGPNGYTFFSGTGTNCSFNGSTATASVAAGKPATNATCNFTNSFTAPATLTVIKQMVNDNGGTAVSSDFVIEVDGTGATPDSFNGADTPGTQVTLEAGAYSVAEVPEVGYAATYSDDCSGTIAAGESKTCTITNDDIQPTLTVIKVVDNTNGGTLTIGDFPLFVGLVSVVSGDINAFDAGAYVVSETGDADYTASFSGDCDIQGNITLSVGDIAECTITNAYQAPLPGSITVIKQVTNDDGGIGVAADFTINVDATNPSDDSFSGSSVGTLITVTAGDYEITESAALGYAVSYSADCSGTIAAGESKTCTITNDDSDTFSITGQKFEDEDSDGRWNNGQEDSMGGVVINLYSGVNLIDTDTTSVVDGSYSFDQIAPGTYTVCEVVPLGWEQTTPDPADNDVNDDGCYEVVITDANIGPLDFGNHEIDIVCRTGSISGVVFNDDNANDVFDETELPLPGWQVYIDANGNDALDEGESVTETNAQGEYSFSGLLNGTYVVREVIQGGWIQTTPGSEGGFEHELTLVCNPILHCCGKW